MQFKDISKTKTIVEEIEGLLAEVEGVGKVHGHYYLLATELYKTEGDHANYYRYLHIFPFMGLVRAKSNRHPSRQDSQASKSTAKQLAAK